MRLIPISGFLLSLIVLTGLTGCSTRPSLPSLPDISLPNAVKPYKSEVIQGNFVSREQVAALRSGMSRGQVKNILGTPLLTDVFHANRWDYVFTIERDGVTSKPRRLTVYFNGDDLARWEGDEMPSEIEFASSLQSGRKIGKIPPLTATDKELADFSARENKKATNTTTNNDVVAPSNKTYPALESK